MNRVDVLINTITEDEAPAPGGWPANGPFNRENPLHIRLVLDKSGGHCWWCGAAVAAGSFNRWSFPDGEKVLGRYWHRYNEAGSRATAQIDRVVPAIAGGSDRLENLVAACRPCNTLKNESVNRAIPASSVIHGSEGAVVHE